MKKGLRWHAQVRTTDGSVTTYVRIRAHNAGQAILRAQERAQREHKDSRYTDGDWHVIWIGLHEADQNNLTKEEGS